MIACPKCRNQSPDGSQHCVHCGHRFGGDDHQSTRMGMPMLRPAGTAAPASERGTGSKTAQFGAEDLARLAAAAAEGEVAPDGGEEDSGQRPSLLAGLPRPRVSSTPSPLTNGMRQGQPRARRTAEAPQSARRTVIGMPVLMRDASPATNRSAAEEAAASIEPLASFQPEEEAPAEAAAAEVTPEVAAPAAPAPVQQVAPSVAPEVAKPTPAAPDPRPTKPAPTTPVARPTKPEPVQPEPPPASGGDVSRPLALLVGLGLLVAFAYPLAGQWAWKALGSLEGARRLGLLAVGGAGLGALLAGFAPLRPGARWGALVVLLGAAVYGFTQV